VLHAAMDMWSHTYVNLMVGDPFSIADNPETAERHVAIETYFTKFHKHPLDLYSQGNGADYLSTLNVPASFVRKTLILNPAVRKQYAAEPTTFYLAAINDYVVQLLAAKNVANIVIGNLNDELLGLQPVINLLEFSFNGVKSAQLAFETQIKNHLGLSQNLVNLGGRTIENLSIEAYLNNVQAYLADRNLPLMPQPIIDFAVGASNSLPFFLNFITGPLNNLSTSLEKFQDDVEQSGYEFRQFADFENFKEALGRSQQALIAAPFDAKKQNIEAAMDAYVVAWEKTAKNIIRSSAGINVPGGGTAEPLQKWALCWLPSMGLQPSPILASQACDFAATTNENVSFKVNEAKQTLLAHVPFVPGLQDIVERINTALLDQAASSMTTTFNQFNLIDNFDGGGIGNWAVRMWDKNLTAEDVDQAFLDHTSPENYIKRRASRFVNLEFGACRNIEPSTTYNEVPVKNFAPMQNAIVMSKLALLPGRQLNNLVRNYFPLGGTSKKSSITSNSVQGQSTAQAAVQTSIFTQLYALPKFDTKRKLGGVLLGALRSIDGDHQWLPYAPPMFREGVSNPPQTTCRRYGYPAGNSYGTNCAPDDDALHQASTQTQQLHLGNRKGFLLYNNPEVRKRVFDRLFAPVDTNMCKYLGKDSHPGLSCGGSEKFPMYPEVPIQATNIAAIRAAKPRVKKRLTRGIDSRRSSNMKALSNNSFASFKGTASDKRNTNKVEMSNAYLLSLLSYIAYPGAATNNKVTERVLQPVIQSWGLNYEGWLDRKTIGIGSGSTQVLFASDASNFFVAFRGSTITMSDMGQDWIDNNLDLSPHPKPDWGRGVVMHDGFYDAAAITFDPVMKIIEQRAKGKKIWLTGHSLGGAVAVITAFEMERRQKNSVGGVYIYGAPPVGNAAWAVQYNKRVPNTHRWSLQNDPVALVMVQLPGPFKHVGQRHNLTNKGIDLNEKREMRYPLRAGIQRLISDLSTTHMGYWCRLQSATNIPGAPTPLNSECDLCSI